MTQLVNGGKLKLHAVKCGAKDRVWCGPAAICIITGCTLQEAKEAFYKVRGRRYVAGVQYHEVLEVLCGMGYRTELIHSYEWELVDGVWKKKTFAAWLRQRDNINDMHLLRLTGHFVVVQGRKMADNHTREPVFIRSAPHRRRRVNNAWKITRAI